MNEIEYAIPKKAFANDIKRVRNLLEMTQKEFARFVGVSVPTIERWESSTNQIKGPIVVLLDVIENNIDYINKVKLPKKTFPIRLKYMYNQKLCTLIDVNEAKQEIKVYNYTKNIMFRAFGSIENPTFNDYQEFLKSRCFPETRDKLKLILEDLNLPFYDPFLIIQKTQGRMSEDDFWIEIEE